MEIKKKYANLHYFIKLKRWSREILITIIAFWWCQYRMTILLVLRWPVRYNHCVRNTTFLPIFLKNTEAKVLICIRFLWRFSLASTYPTRKSCVDGGGFQIAEWQSIQSHQILTAGKRTCTSCGKELRCSRLLSCRSETHRSRIRLNICKDTTSARSCNSDR